MANRLVRDVPSKKIKVRPLIEWRALYDASRGRLPQDVYLRRNADFQKSIPTSSIVKSSAVIGYDTSSWVLAAQAAERNKHFFLDQSTAHPLAKDKIFKQIATQYPEWQDSLVQRSPELLLNEEAEYHFATKIVTASAYSKQTFIDHGIPAEKLIVNPYGVDLQIFRPHIGNRPERPIRFLFLGAISALKGVPLLQNVWESLSFKDAELWVVGPINARTKSLLKEAPGMRLMGKQPHNLIPEMIRQCDVLVFPSYSEGFGLVILEALASGLPVISTENTGAPDIIQSGIEGFITPIGDEDALGGAMKFFVNNQNQLKMMSEAARGRAEQFSWDSYGDRWQEILRQAGVC
ncbi:MAG: glycosyltransferase family 4 protein [Acidobacteria bacterium]|nr:glycosyltransferase family 4 protein [Acidobacteriota bacterium]